jgi:alkylation response protein AidB-like acyl-CoA dehydrogenase
MLLYPRTDRQARFVEMAASFVPRLAGRAAEHDRTGAFPLENFAELRRAGYHTLAVAERFGGLGAGLLDVALAQLTLGKGDGATALSMNMHLMTIGIAGESRPWPEETFERLCVEVVRDGALLNSAAAEPELGSPASGGRPATVARPVDGGWRISGRKTFVSASPVLTYFIVLATLAGDENPPRVANFLVPNGAPGVTVEPTWDVVGMRATASNDVVFEDVFVPGDALLNQRVLGQADARGGSNTAWFALTASAVYLGIAEAARDFAVEFATARTPTALAHPISALPAVQWKAADMEIALPGATQRAAARDRGGKGGGDGERDPDGRHRHAHRRRRGDVQAVPAGALLPRHPGGTVPPADRGPRPRADRQDRPGPDSTARARAAGLIPILRSG